MKTTAAFILSCLILISGCRNVKERGQQYDSPADTGKAVLAFSEYEHDFGKVEEGGKISYKFSYENTGTAPLAISSVTTTCGCTVPRFDKHPIKPGETGSLEVIFNTTGRNGIQTKVISVNSNASIPVILLKITAEVQQE
ncbi:MAG TPA: DUF1573 domain-containing protein [Bacteroidales bacterium]|nr:DUF1573 domain-containing protein [Bacteroidales bacterium]